MQDKGNLIITRTKPACSLIFLNDQFEEVGRFDWEKGELQFTGKVDESAKVLFDFLKLYIDDYIEWKTKNKSMI